MSCTPRHTDGVWYEMRLVLDLIKYVLCVHESVAGLVYVPLCASKKQLSRVKARRLSEIVGGMEESVGIHA